MRAAMKSWTGVAMATLLALLMYPPRVPAQQQPAFPTAEEAARALGEAAKASDVSALVALLGPGSGELASSSDPATARKNRDVFVAAMAERWRLEDRGANRKELIVGNESWPFPVPLVKRPQGWSFDTAAGKEEVISRRIGRNELAVIRICQTFVVAQQNYARQGHDGKPAGIYARRVSSAPGSENGLYWPQKQGGPRSPLGDLVAEAAAEGQRVGPDSKGPVPFHGYYFRILEGQGSAAAGGAKSYVVNGEMSGGFGLIAWPAQPETTGIMTFIVNQDGAVYEKSLGAGTQAAVAAITRFNPDKTWRRAAPAAR
jgi:Protein of unknown function (DUF2950)